MEKLQKIINRCKCSVTITVNDHKDMYQTVEQYLNDRFDIADIDSREASKMVATDTIICIQVYPDTPIGSYTVYGHNLDEVIDNVLEILEDK